MFSLILVEILYIFNKCSRPMISVKISSFQLCYYFYSQRCPIWRQELAINVGMLLLLLLLSRFSRVRLCVTPQMAAHQAPPSLGFSGQEHWSGLPLPSPMHESEVAQLCPTLCDPMDCSLPGSSIHVIFQARVLEWGAIAFTISVGINHPKVIQ